MRRDLQSHRPSHAPAILLFLVCAFFFAGRAHAANMWNHNQDFPWSKPGNAPAVYHHGRFFILSGANGVWASQTGAVWDCVCKTPPWAPRTDHMAVSFLDKIWVMGGRDTYNFFNDVWSSFDGVDWVREADAPWPGRALSGAIVFNNRLLLLGGMKMTEEEDPVTSQPFMNYDYFNEAWSTADGSAWEQKSHPWQQGRALPGLVIHNNQLWLMGGASEPLPVLAGNQRGIIPPSEWLYDVWVSNNGTDWTQKTHSAPWGRDWSLSAFSYDGRLRVMGCLGQNEWNSIDGINWQPIPAAPPQLPPMWGQSAITVGDQFYILSGGEPTSGTTPLIGKVWTSSDAVKWTHAGSDTQIWQPRWHHRAIDFKGRIWLTGGMALSTEITSLTGEVWKSTILPAEQPGFYKLAGWEQIDADAPWGARWGHGALAYADRMWIFGGCDDHRTYGDVWSKAIDSSWTLVTENAWPARSHFASAVHNGRMWVICGTDRPTSLTERADVYFSGNGLNWVKTADPVPFRARMGMGAVSFNGKLWVIGGSYDENGRQYPPEAWSTGDGTHWTLETDSLPFARQDFATAVCGGRLYVLGGANGSSLYNDVWSTADGVNWEPEGAAPWSPRRGLSAVYFNRTSLWIMGGYGHEVLNDVWMLPFRTGVNNAWMRIQ
ncbi:hypothetical protein LLG95_13480 [bacterium]|nr:hypothetical protein [bacterium]